MKRKGGSHNLDKSHNHKYIITMHARERYKERVNPNGNNNPQAIVKWLKRALNEGYEVSKNKEGDTCYRYGKYLVVMNGKTLITISYHNRQDVKPLKDDINKIIARRLRKDIKQFATQRKDLMVKAREAEIEGLRTNSRPKQLRLFEECDQLLTEAKELRKQVGSIIDLGNRYGLEKSELVREVDLL